MAVAKRKSVLNNKTTFRKKFKKEGKI